MEVADRSFIHAKEQVWSRMSGLGHGSNESNNQCKICNGGQRYVLWLQTIFSSPLGSASGPRTPPASSRNGCMLKRSGARTSVGTGRRGFWPVWDTACSWQAIETLIPILAYFRFGDSPRWWCLRHARWKTRRDYSASESRRNRPRDPRTELTGRG